MEIFLIIIPGYILPGIVLGIILLTIRRKTEKQHLNTWKQSSNLQELVINALEESNECNKEGSVPIPAVFIFIPILNIGGLIFVTIILLIDLISYMFSKIPIK